MSAVTLSSTAGPAPARRPSYADLSVNVKVLLAVGVAALVALAVGVMGLVRMSTVSTAAEKISTSNVTSIKAVGQLKFAVVVAVSDMANQALSTTDAST